MSSMKPSQGSSPVKQSFAASQTPERNTSGRGSSGRRQNSGRDGRSGGRGTHSGRSGDGYYGDRNSRGGGEGRRSPNVGRGRSGRGNFQRTSDNNQHRSTSTSILPGAPPAHPSSSVPYGYLPPFLPGASSLVEQLDQKMLVVLRDGRHLVGTLRSFDQFSNMVLEDTSERRILVVQSEKSKEDENQHKQICYQADVKLGLYIVRGDSVVLMGEVDDCEDDATNGNKIQLVTLEELEQLEEEERKRKEEKGEAMEHIDWEFDLDLVA